MATLPLWQHATYLLPNDVEFNGEKEGAQRLTPSPLQRGVRPHGSPG